MEHLSRELLSVATRKELFLNDENVGDDVESRIDSVTDANLPLCNRLFPPAPFVLCDSKT